MKSYFQDVGEFHAKFGLPITRRDRPAAFPAPEVVKYRFQFMQEELTEFAEGCTENDLAKVADALADLVYVALGTAHYFGIPFEEVWQAVQQANMRKIRTLEPNLEHKRGMVEVIRKPIDWEPPRITLLLNMHNSVAASYKKEPL